MRALSAGGDPAKLDWVERAQREKLPQQLRRTIRKRQMFVAGERVVVAVSGGADSVALLAALAEARNRLDITLLCGHFNHRLRGAEADGDEEFVAALCERFGLPFHSGRAKHALVGASIEARARRERYAFLRALAAQQGALRIATAHTLDDQAETVLMRLLRGSGSDGLRAIRAVRGILVRPLIEISRASVLDYLAARGLAYRTDTSNRDLRFLRNRVRHEVLPALAAINPSVRDALARTAATIESDAADLDRRASRRHARLRRGRFLLAAETARLVDPLRSRVLRLWLRGCGVRQAEHSHVAALTALLLKHAHGAVSLSRGRQARVAADANCGADVLLLEDAKPRPLKYDFGCERMLVDGDVIEHAESWRIEVCRRPARPEDHGPQEPHTFVADAGQLPGRLWLRVPHRGDRLRVHGLGGCRKLQDVFTDRHVPRARRADWPVLGSGAEILWLPGLARGDQALVSAGTTDVWHVRVRETVVAGLGRLCYVPDGSIDK